jgi:hypothetical protein
VAGEVAIPVRTRRIEPPLEDVPRDDRGAGHLASGRPLTIRADVDEDRPAFDRLLSIVRAEPRDSSPSLIQQLVDRDLLTRPLVHCA